MTDTRPITRALSPQPGDLEHPAHDVLVAFVDGQADSADAEWIDAHMDVCARCREDVSDLRDVQQQLAQRPVAVPPTRRRDLRRITAFGAIAAALVLAAWLGGAFTREAPAPASVVVSTPPAGAPAPPLPPSSAPVQGPSQADQQMLDRALATGEPRWPAFHDLIRSRAGTLLGGTPSLPSLTPTAPISTAVLTDRPEFTWTSTAGATSYEVAVYDEAFAQVASSGPITATGWRPDRDLPRGRVLTWQISAITSAGTIVSPAPPQPEARFIVLDEAAVTAVNTARRRLAHDPLALGVALAEAGLYREAEAMLLRAVEDARYDARKVRQIIAALR